MSTKNNKKLIRWGIIGCGDVTEVKSGPAFYKTEGPDSLRDCAGRTIKGRGSLRRFIKGSSPEGMLQGAPLPG